MLRKRFTYANVVASLALFVALGGTGYAAVTITGHNVKDGSLTGRDIARRSVPLDRLKGTLPRSEAGARGPAGAAGPIGPAGEPGAAGATHVVTRRAFNYIGGGGSATVTSSCNPGEVAVGGGGRLSTDNASIEASVPTSTTSSTFPASGEVPNGWLVAAYNGDATTRVLYVWALCATP